MQTEKLTTVKNQVRQLTEFLLYIDPDLPTEEELLN